MFGLRVLYDGDLLDRRILCGFHNTKDGRLATLAEFGADSISLTVTLAPTDHVWQDPVSILITRRTLIYYAYVNDFLVIHEAISEPQIT